MDLCPDCHYRGVVLGMIVGEVRCLALKRKAGVMAVG